jgi:RNA polymerase sigma-70 factor (ECF subfamily)
VGVAVTTRTTTQLLDALRDQSNQPVWSQTWAAIDARYRPVIAALARRLGASDADADEVAQQTLSEFVKGYAQDHYDRKKGRLSSWILGIAHHTTLRMLKVAQRVKPASHTHLAEVADESALRSIWTDERDRAILAQAMAELRSSSGVDERTINAFELVALRGVPASEVANQCQMTVDQVYVAKSRVTKKLRELVETLTKAFEEDE